MIKVTVDIGQKCVASLDVWNNKKAPPGVNRQEYEYRISVTDTRLDVHDADRGTVRHDRRNGVWVLIDRVLNASGFAIPDRKS